MVLPGSGHMAKDASRTADGFAARLQDVGSGII